uniref:Transmembrane protein n=1 Tax=Manihot esculenta TaxID=3983 RepID=A0A2C9V150_MANES
MEIEAFVVDVKIEEGKHNAEKWGESDVVSTCPSFFSFVNITLLGFDMIFLLLF